MRLVTVSDQHPHHPERIGITTMLWSDQTWMVRFLPQELEETLSPDSIKRKLLSCDGESMGALACFAEAELSF